MLLYIYIKKERKKWHAIDNFFSKKIQCDSCDSVTAKNAGVYMAKNSLKEIIIYIIYKYIIYIIIFTAQEGWKKRLSHCHNCNNCNASCVMRAQAYNITRCKKLKSIFPEKSSPKVLPVQRLLLSLHQKKVLINI